MYTAKIGHAHLKVSDLERSIDFYTRVFNLRVVERAGNYAFLTGGSMHHEIALQALGPRAAPPVPHGIGLYHVAFEVPDQRAMALAYKNLRESGVEVAMVDHLISWAMYFDDPDGNGLEIYWDRRTLPGGAEIWRGRNLPLLEEKLLAVLDNSPSEA